MTREELQELFDLSVLPCEEAVGWASEQENQSVKELFAACLNHEWREFVALYSRSVAILEKLARDDDWWIRNGVASNPSASADILEELARDERRWVRTEAARNLERRKI